MPAYPHIDRYRADLAELIQFGGSENELSIRPAFQNCLAAYCRGHRENLALIPELRAPRDVVPDGTVKDALRMARGYWEAKDSADDLDAEIQRKIERGYPKDNILFEDSIRAVLIQNGEQAMSADMSRPADLHRLIRRFLDYELPQIEEFKRAQTRFAADLPSVLDNLRAAIDDAEAENDEYSAAAAEFLDLCRQSIGPDVSPDDVREMLIQHILTRDIFLRVFGEDQFHQENDIARRLDALEKTFFTREVRRNAIDRLRAYYGAIGRAADEIADYAEKQAFLKRMYEDFYKTYNPEAADRLGVVYTPNEIVDFMVRSSDALLRRHFGRELADPNVQILDPATGTGTFITSLIEYLPASSVEHKYLNEIRANEVAILPYYIAALNIEYTYRERMGRYREFPNLCFVDTLDNMEWQQSGSTEGRVTRQVAFELGAISFENRKRIESQNEKTISVIIGNPPYNANQRNWNDFNPNREYPEIDQRIRESYIKDSSAQKVKQYDMYKRFIRWASDRLADDGIVAFITNRAYIDSHQDDGFRKVVLEEFGDLYIIDLGGDMRKNGKVGNVFGIMTGVAIGFLVRRSDFAGNGKIRYYALDDALSGADKLAELSKLDIMKIDFASITPDKNNNWLEQGNPDFENLLLIAHRNAKLGKVDASTQTIFRLYTPGVATNRDEWVYDFAPDNLQEKAAFFAQTYNAILDSEGEPTDTTIKWSRDLRNKFKRGRRITYKPDVCVPSLYRPFTVKQHFANPMMNDVLTKNHYEMFGPDLRGDNKVICFSMRGIKFYTLASNRLMDLHFTGDTQCLPIYRYAEDGGRICNIRDWAIRHINDHYRAEWGKDFAGIYPDGISAEDIFAYAYAVLHDPVYRHDYRNDLLREFPRLPLYSEFDIWVKMGARLLDLHLNFETVEPYPLERRDKTPPNPNAASTPRPRLKADKERGIIVIDDRTTLSGVPEDAWRYTLGNRSALEWVLDQHKEKKPRDPTIRDRFNKYRLADRKEQLIELLGRVCAVSVGTMEIVDDMAYWDAGNLIVFGDRDKHELAMLALSHWFSEPEDEEWLAQWSEM